MALQAGEWINSPRSQGFQKNSLTSAHSSPLLNWDVVYVGILRCQNASETAFFATVRISLSSEGIHSAKFLTHGERTKAYQPIHDSDPVASSRPLCYYTAAKSCVNPCLTAVYQTNILTI